jgi:hypothetical protein
MKKQKTIAALGEDRKLNVWIFGARGRVVG